MYVRHRIKIREHFRMTNNCLVNLAQSNERTCWSTSTVNSNEINSIFLRKKESKLLWESQIEILFVGGCWTVFTWNGICAAANRFYSYSIRRLPNRPLDSFQCANCRCTWPRHDSTHLFDRMSISFSTSSMRSVYTHSVVRSIFFLFILFKSFVWHSVRQQLMSKENRKCGAT